MKTVQPCKAGWPSAARHRGGLWVGSGCWELRVSRSCPLIDDTICGSLPVRALNFGWREMFVWVTREKKSFQWTCLDRGPRCPWRGGGGGGWRGSGTTGGTRLHLAGFHRALDSELASCRGICISRINKEQQQQKKPLVALSLWHGAIFFLDRVLRTSIVLMLLSFTCWFRFSLPFILLLFCLFFLFVYFYHLL